MGSIGANLSNLDGVCWHTGSFSPGVGNDSYVVRILVRALHIKLRGNTFQRLDTYESRLSIVVPKRLCREMGWQE
jgi:hypothetical protein